MVDGDWELGEKWILERKREDFLSRGLSAQLATNHSPSGEQVRHKRFACSSQAFQANEKESHMKSATISTELNAAGPDVDRAISEFLKQQVVKQKCHPCVPSLALIALAVLEQTGRKTSPYIVKLRLKELGVEEEIDTAVEARKREHRPQTAAAGLNGHDRAFLRSCGIKTEG